MWELSQSVGYPASDGCPTFEAQLLRGYGGKQHAADTQLYAVRCELLA